jgi:hypothetical protein
VASGHYGRVEIDATNPSGRGVRFDTLDVTGTGVRAPTGAMLAGHGTIRAARVVGTGTISWTSFNQVVDLTGLQQYGLDPKTLTVSGATGGHITMTAPVVVGGQTIQARATGSVSVTNNVLHVAIADVHADDGGVVDAVAQLAGIKQLLNFDVPLPALPYHLRLDSVRTTTAGVTLTATATDVVLAG